MADVDINAGVNQANANRVQLGNLFSGQRAESDNFLGRLTNTIGNQETTSALSQRIGSELGLPTLRANTSALQDTIFKLPDTYSKAMTGYDVNANQLARVIGQKQSELSPAAALSEKNLQAAESNLTQRLGYEQRDQDRALIPFQYESDQLNSRLAREATGYTTQMQSELDAIISRMNAGITLSEGEKNRAQQLAISEREFDNQMKMAEYQNSVASSQPNYVQINGGIYDTTSGSYKLNPPPKATGTAAAGYSAPAAASRFGTTGESGSTMSSQMASYPSSWQPFK